MTVDREFFLSFTGADRPWAEWLLAELDAAGYSSVSQLRDFVAGSNFAVEMDQAARRARRTLGVLSPQALQAPFVRQEWAQRLAGDPTGEQRALMLVRVEPCEPEGLLGPVVYIDLVGLDEATARARLREELAATVHGTRPQLNVAEYPGGGPAGVVTEKQRPRFPTALPPVWNVPFRRNLAFTGREQALTVLADQLGREAATAVSQTIQGAGGIGKTALAVEYAYRHQSEFDTVWWVRAQEPASLVSDYAALAGALKLPAADEADQQVVAAAVVRRWLDAHDRWLLILDNAESPDTPTGLQTPLGRLIDLVPQVLRGQVLVTSRDASWDRYASLTELELFTPDEAVAFLLARSASNDQTSATEVAELLGLLPLALEQAGAYVRETRLPLAAYLERLRQYPVLTVARGRPRDRDPADTVATTWQVSLEQVQPVPGAMGLLELCAFLGSEALPRDLFATQLDSPAAELAALTEDPFAVDDAIAALHRFALVKANEQTLIVHRLLQQVIREQLDPAAASNRAGTVVRLLAEAFPRKGLEDPGVWPRCAQLLPHAVVAAEHAEHYQVEAATTSDLLDRAAGYLDGRGRYSEARTLAERALKLAETAYGPENQVIATRLRNVARSLRAQGELGTARTLYERALAIYEARLGPEDPDTLGTRHDLARVLQEQDQLDAAEAQYRSVLALRRRVLGRDHPDTLGTRHALASLLQARGHPDEAEAEFRAVLELQRQGLGADHPDTLGTRHNLAFVLQEQGQLDQAEAEYQAVLKLRQGRLGRDHPDTLNTRHARAWLLQARGHPAEAEAEYRAILELQRQGLGADHPDTLGTRHNLARLLRDQGQLDQAEAEFRAVLEVRRRVFGDDHRHTLTTRHALAYVLQKRRQRAEAEAEYRAILELQQQGLGADHPDTLVTRHNLARLLQEQGQLDQAEAEFRAVLEVRRRVFGDDHRHTLTTRHALAYVLQKRGQRAEAEAEYRAILELQRQGLGADHPDTLGTRHNLASLLQARGHLDEAEAMFRSVLESRRRVLGPDHPTTVRSRERLARVRAALENRR